jgi:hypothetical protein
VKPFEIASMMARSKIVRPTVPSFADFLGQQEITCRSSPTCRHWNLGWSTAEVARTPGSGRSSARPRRRWRGWTAPGIKIDDHGPRHGAWEARGVVTDRGQTVPVPTDRHNPAANSAAPVRPISGVSWTMPPRAAARRARRAW